jgi:hypothetical protein
MRLKGHADRLAITSDRRIGIAFRTYRERARVRLKSRRLRGLQPDRLAEFGNGAFEFMLLRAGVPALATVAVRQDVLSSGLVPGFVSDVYVLTTCVKTWMRGQRRQIYAVCASLTTPPRMTV